jgi:hypothetical protein
VGSSRPKGSAFPSPPCRASARIASAPHFFRENELPKSNWTEHTNESRESAPVRWWFSSLLSSPLFFSFFPSILFLLFGFHWLNRAKTRGFRLDSRFEPVLEAVRRAFRSPRSEQFRIVLAPPEHTQRLTLAPDPAALRQDPSSFSASFTVVTADRRQRLSTKSGSKAGSAPGCTPSFFLGEQHADCRSGACSAPPALRMAAAASPGKVRLRDVGPGKCRGLIHRTRTPW